MKFSKIVTVYKKEIKETLRDRRTLGVMILVPLLLYPALFSVMGQIMMIGGEKLEREKSTVAYLAGVPAELDRLVRGEDNLAVLASEDPVADLQDGAIQAYLEIKRFASLDSLFICFDAARDRSRLARKRLQNVVQVYKRTVQERMLREAAVDLAVLDPLGVRAVNTASPARMGGMMLGFIIPMLLIVTLMLGAMYPAIDLTAGEKERGTLETILTVPVSRQELLLGKFFTVSTIACMTGFLNLFSMSLAYSVGFIQLGALSGKLELTFSPIVLLILFLAIVPLALFISALMLSISIFARSFKDAQNLITPFYIVLMMPAFFALAPGIELTHFLALIPILNVALLFKEVLLQTITTELVFAVFLSNTVFAFMAILIFSKIFNAEEILFAERKGWQFSFRRSEITREQVLQPANAMLVLSFILILLFYLAPLAQLRLKHWGLFITEWLLIFLPVVLAIWYNKVDYRTALCLKGFSAIAFLGTMLIVLAGLALSVWVAQVQVKLFPESAKIGEVMEKILNLQSTGIHPALGLFVFAVSPGICEELLFRGLLLSSFKERLSPAFAVLSVAILFGIFHIHIFRLVPTALVGLYLTFIVYKTGSIYLSIIGHTLNNGLAVLILSYPQFGAHFGWLTGEAPVSPLVVLTTILVAALGVFLVDRSGAAGTVTA